MGNFMSFTKAANYQSTDTRSTEPLQLEMVLRPGSHCIPSISSGTSATKGDQSSANGYEKLELFCGICVEHKDAEYFFWVDGCTHFYCINCIVQHVASKLQLNITTITCPVDKCEGSLDPESCGWILPEEVFIRWGKALCEGQILGSERFYCPFKDCSALLINDGREAIRESECPHCRRMFCAQCKVPWHESFECAEFQKLKKEKWEREDIMLMKTAKKEGWKRCPKCRFYVQKVDGCWFVKCRCGVEFCYRCGKRTRKSHICSSCKR